MRIEWRSTTDRDEVVARIAKATKQRRTLPRDRLRVVLLAGDGDEEGRELFRTQIAGRVGRSRQFVDQWVGRYRKGGLDAIVAKKQPGRAPKLTAAQDEQLRAILDGGPRPADKVCTLRGRDVRRIVEAEFGVVYTAGGIYDVLRRLDYSSLKPRPRHRKNGPGEGGGVRATGPLFARAVKRANPGKTLRWFVSDEARVGQQGTLTRVWARTGTRPAAVEQCEYEWVYLWAAADPFSGDAIAMITPTVDTDPVQTFIDGLSGHTGPEEHAILVLDNAGWHRAKDLAWPANVTPLFLPPYSPELNSAENLWQWLRSQYLSNQVFEDVGDLLHKTDAAWLALTPERIKTLCHCPWIVRANQA